MSFAEFKEKLDRERGRDTEEFIHMLRDLANDVDASDDYETFEECLHALIAEISGVLEREESPLSPVMYAIYEITDNLIDDLEEGKGHVHTCLRHIKHQQDDLPYAQAIQTKLSEKFNSNGVMAFSASQYFSYGRDGSISLNRWGELVLERMDEMQMMEAYNAPDYELDQIYTSRDLCQRA